MPCLRLSIAGIEIELRCNREALAALEDRYGAFQRDKNSVAPTEATIEIELYCSGDKPWSADHLVIDHHGHHLKLHNQVVSATVSTDGRQAQIRAPLSDRSVDVVLRHVLAERLLRQGGLLLHASAIVINGRAWVFAGPSGAGKSTLVKHLTGRVLGDEGIALRCQGDTPWVHATPYWTAQPGSAPLHSLVFIRQGTENDWQVPTPGRAASRLMSCTGPHAPTSTDLLMGVVQRSIEAIGPRVIFLTLDSIESIRTWLEREYIQSGGLF